MHRRRLILAAGAAAGLPLALRWPLASAADDRFALGVASGTPRADGMVLWTRLVGPGLPASTPVRWEVAEDDAFERVVARGEATAVADEAMTVHAEPRGLSSDRWYRYRFHALGQTSRTGRTRTAPAPDAAVASMRFAIASCQRYDVGHYAAWRAVAEGEPDAILFLGDYIYETPTSRSDGPRRHEGGHARTLDGYRDRYATYKSDPHLQAAHAAAPWLVVWDDHEVANDYADTQGQDLAPDFAERRAQAYRAYWEHMPFPRAWKPSGRPGAEGGMRIHHRLDWGRLARIHLLDDRQYRDPQACPRPGRGGSNVVARAACPELDDPRRTLLGRAQEAWLADGWSLDRPWNLVGQQTLMSRFAWGDAGLGPEATWTDGWDGYAPARERLLGTVAAKKVPGVVVLGGDVHSHYVTDLKADYDATRSPVVATEFVSSSISSLSGLSMDRVRALLPFNPHIHYARTDLRGAMAFALDRERCEASVLGVERPLDPASPVSVLARFVAEARRPGAQRA